MTLTWKGNNRDSVPWLPHTFFFRVPNLQNLMPNSLRWSWCNNNRNKVHSECNVFESSPNHSHSSLSMEKLSSMKPVPGAKKVGDRCPRWWALSKLLPEATLQILEPLAWSKPWIHPFINCYSFVFSNELVGECQNFLPQGWEKGLKNEHLRKDSELLKLQCINKAAQKHV